MNTCTLHPGRMMRVCGEFRCAGCYELELQTATDRPPEAYMVEYVKVYDPYKHRFVEVRKDN